MDTIYRLCLQIEWHRSRSRQTGGVLGSPKKNFVDNGQARSKIFFVQEGKGEQTPYKRHIAGMSSGQSHTIVYSVRPDIRNRRLYDIAIYTPAE